MSNLSLGSANLNQIPLSSLLGYEQFNQATKPTVRRDGSALQQGDRWYDTTDSLWWVWDGTYWKGEFILSSHIDYAFNLFGPVRRGFLVADRDYDLWLESLRMTRTYGPDHDGSNHFKVQTRYRTINDGASVVGAEGNTILAFGPPPETPLDISLGLHLDVNALGIAAVQCLITPQGDPPLSGYVVGFNYRLVKR